MCSAPDAVLSGTNFEFDRWSVPAVRPGKICRPRRAPRRGIGRDSLALLRMGTYTGGMDIELLKVLAPYFTSILGAVVAIGIAIHNNKKLNAFLRRGKLMDDVEKVDMDSLADGVAGKKPGVPVLWENARGWQCALLTKIN